MIGILAAEPSGDQLGAGLIARLKQVFPNEKFIGIGGPLMQAEGFQSIYPMQRLAVMGFIEPLKRLPELFRIRRKIKNFFLQQRPKIFIGIDAPDFNLGLEIGLRQAGIPVIHYVSPSVWAWRPKRVFKVAKACDLILTLFPFEVEFYKKYNIAAKFVGHPLADKISSLNTDKLAVRKSLCLDINSTYLAILPGSRFSEIALMLPIFLQAAELCQKQIKNLSIISAVADSKHLAKLNSICQSAEPNLAIKIFSNAATNVIAASDAVLVTSGTATLEAMLVGRPMVIAYKMSKLIYSIVRPFIKAPFMGLPNLLAGKKLVPELVQKDVTAKKLAEHLMQYLLYPNKNKNLYSEFNRIHKELKCGADSLAASAVIELINKVS